MRYFIQRRDAKAVQQPNGDYYPVRRRTSDPNQKGPLIPLTLQDVQDHLDKKITYGHYLLDSANMCRVLAFDIDLNKTGFYPAKPTVDGNSEGVEFKPMEYWMSRHPGFPRDWIKYQFRWISEMIAQEIRRQLDLPALITYSGSKGVHVYALTGPITGEQARDGIDIILDGLGFFVPIRGRNFFRHENTDPVHGFPNFTIEVFPKQKSVTDKQERLGNLMRLPLGRNRKTKDPTFFVDCRAPYHQLVPLDPYVALTTLDPWGGGK